MNSQYCTHERPVEAELVVDRGDVAGLAPGSTSNAAGSPVTRTKKKIVSDSRNSDSSA